MSTRRENLIRAMNPPHGEAWSSESQALNLLLHDLAASMPAGWSLGYEVCNDDSAVSPRNRDVFDAEQKARWREWLALRRDAGDDDAADDVSEIPARASGGSGHHVLLQMVHADTGAQVVRWVDREQLAAVVRQANRTPAQRLAAARAHVDAALVAGEARVARKRQRLKSVDVGLRER